MKLPKNAVVAVADGELLNLYRNTGDEGAPVLAAMAAVDVSATNAGSGNRHQSSSANPSESQQNEDGFARGIAALLNKDVLEGRIDNLVIVAAPRTLGELRKHYHKALEAKLVGEVSKDLTGHSAADVQKAVVAA